MRQYHPEPNFFKLYTLLRNNNITEYGITIYAKHGSSCEKRSSKISKNKNQYLVQIE